MSRNKKRLNLSIPFLTGKEKKYVDYCLRTGWISSAGKLIDEFEKKICLLTKSKYGVACVNGTSALHISLLLAGVKDNHEVIVPTITFIAPINAVRYCNASPVFMDCDNDYNLDLKKTIEFISSETYLKNNKSYNKKTNKRISALIVVHVWGNTIEFYNLKKLCDKKNIKIIEDASESLGSKFDNNKFSGTLGFCGCISFNGNKIITTGGGGIILTQNKKIAEKAKHLTQQAKKNIWFEHDEIGYNYRMNNIQAAIGLGQIESFNELKKRKKNIYKNYSNLFNKNIEFSFLKHNIRSNFWMNVIKIKNFNKIKLKKLINLLNEKKIEARPIWMPNHLQAKYKIFQSYKIKKASKFFNQSLCIPSSVELTNSDIKIIYKTISSLI